MFSGSPAVTKSTMQAISHYHELVKRDASFKELCLPEMIINELLPGNIEYDCLFFCFLVTGVECNLKLP